MEEKIAHLKEWLGTGSINVFGLPMSGKDTQGVRLAEALGARFLSSGMIIRAMEKETGEDLTSSGDLAPTSTFYKWVLPYFEKRELWDSALILSSVGRWRGEEAQVMNVAEGAGHPLKAVVYLDISEEEAVRRWQTAASAGARVGVSDGARADDADLETFRNRIREFHEKTMPVIEEYAHLDLLVRIDGVGSREEVFARIIDRLYKFSTD